MLKSERSDFRQHRNPNEMSPIPRRLDFGRSVCSIVRFELLSTLMYRTEQKIVWFGPLVRISDTNFCLKSEQKRSDFRCFGVRTIIATEPKSSVQNPN